jgi:hypothetical protein
VVVKWFGWVVSVSVKAAGEVAAAYPVLAGGVEES